MTYPCPHCQTTASAETGCPSCGRGPDADAIEVFRVDAEIAELLPQLAAARGTVSDLEARIGHAYARRNQAAERVRASQRADRPKSAPETSSRGVQNVLFLLGGLLLAVAAIVFTAVAWSQVGVAGRAAILGAVTVVTLAVPPFAVRRGLTAAAETIAAVGLLLVLLDGYAAWYVNLFGLAGGEPGRYAGAVFAITAVIAAGYAHLTGLTGPRFAALLAAQPVLPLMVAPATPGAGGWTLTFGVLAALNLAMHRTRLAPLAYVLAALATLAALTPAVVAAIRTLDTARPFFHAAWSAVVLMGKWHLPGALVLVTAALFAAAPARLRGTVLLGGAAAIAVALPAGLRLPWWSGPLLDLVVIAAALALAARHAAPALAVPATRVAAMPAAASPAAPASLASLTGGSGFSGRLVAAALLGAHAVTAGFGRPGMAAAVLSVVALLGLGLAARARSSGLSGAGLFIGLLTVPAIGWTAAAALGLGPAGQVRAVACALAGLVLALRLLPMLRPATPRPLPAPWPAQRTVALIAALPTILLLPLWALMAGQSFTVYAVLTLLLAASATAATRGRDAIGREPEIVTAVAGVVVLGLALAGGALPERTGTLSALGALLTAAAVAGTAGRTARVRWLGAGVAVLAGWGVALAAPAGAVLEAYTLPAAGLALAAALIARRDPAVSWVSYGPALKTALAPSLVLIYAGDGQHLRRLLLGLGALAILLAGARLRLRAPVVAGGVALALLALHELVLLWDLVPRWIPLAAGGVLLVVLATTLERRRRDLDRVREALARMS